MADLLFGRGFRIIAISFLSYLRLWVMALFLAGEAPIARAIWILRGNTFSLAFMAICARLSSFGGRQ